MMLGMINAAAQQVNSCPGHVRARLHRGDEPQCAAASYWRGIIVIEDQESVSAWADQTFGPASSNARVAAVLSRLMTRMGRNLGEELARKTGLHERWIREWLYGQAAANLIDYKGEGRFELSPESALVLANEDSPFFLAGGFCALPQQMAVLITS